MISFLIQLVTGAQARWVGEPPAARCIFFANHSSNLDFPVIWASLPPAIRRHTRPIAARDYWDGSRLRRYLARDVFNAILIERHKVTVRENPLLPMEQALDAGDSLIIFPEGTRALDDDAPMNPFKPGLYHLAKRHPDVTLIPVYLESLNRILPKGGFLLIPLLAAVTFGSPIQLEPGENKLLFLDRARAAVAALEAAHA
mgnify:CR=1 FL=1